MSRAPGSISVVIPCHNYGRFLGEALASVDAQDLRPNQVVICDDGSQDDSLATVERLAAGRQDVLVIRHERPHGLVRTLNELMAVASGELIIPLSADDRMGPGYISAMARAIFRDGWDFAYTDMHCFGAEQWTFVAPDLDLARLARFNFIHGSAGVSRKCVQAIGGYRDDFDTLGFEDYDFWLSAVEAGFRGTKVPDTYLEWRRHPGGSRNTANRSDRLALRWKLLRHHPRFFLHPRSVRACLPALAPRPGIEAPP